MEDSLKQRYTIKLKDPNPLFTQWLTEWREKAIERQSKMQQCLSIALKSLKKYPLPLESGKECSILKGFGKRLCQMLDDKLAVHRAYKKYLANAQNVEKEDTENTYVPVYRSGAYAILLALYTHTLKTSPKGCLLKTDICHYGRPFCDKSFVKRDPGSNYNAWSSMKILLEKGLVKRRRNPGVYSLSDKGYALASQLYKTNLEKQQNNSHVEDDCSYKTRVCKEKNLITTTCSTVVSAANSNRIPRILKNVENNCDNKGHMCEEQIPVTTTASSVVPLASSSCIPQTLNNDENDCNYITHVRNEQIKIPDGSSSSSDILPLNLKNYPSTSTAISSCQNTEDHQSIIFAPYSFDVILLVDTQEISRKNVDPLEEPLLYNLTALNLKFEVRHLKVGDYTWIARNRETEKEVVLPYIIERKRMDDLGSSIKDGRFHEQKFRLKQSGIQNLIYLVENIGNNTPTGLPLSTLYQAATNTLVQDNFCVKFTNSLKETTEYLSHMTSIIIKLYENKILASCQRKDLISINIDDDVVPVLMFQEFNKSATKNKELTVEDMFIRNLLQIKGISLEKALAIVNKYPTPMLLKQAYDSLPPNQGEKLLASIKFGNLNKNIGPILSKIIFQLYTMEVYPG